MGGTVTLTRWMVGLGLALASLALAACSDSHVPVPDAPSPVDAPRGPCDSDRDCSALGLICDAAIGICGECSRESDCAGGAVCLLGACSAPVACTTSRDCPGLVCDPARGRCVECAAPVDCDALVCRADGRCARSAALPCATGADCPGLVCDAASGTCVECVADGDCPARCDVAAHACVECLGDSDCTAPEVCDSASHACVTACTCSVDADCEDGVFCNGTETCGGCVAGCVAGTPVDCPGGASCDEAAGACGAPACSTPTLWFADGDADGWGDLTESVSACARPTGYVISYGDCDDTNVDRNPAALEACNALDDDCDGSVDDGCSCAPFPDGTVRPCGTGTGLCSGMQRCSSGNWGTCAASMPRPEACNDADDDCDGATDETPADASCGVVGATCTAGSCSALAIPEVAPVLPGAFARMSDGTVRRWGAASLGPPVEVMGVDSAIALSMSRDVSCALLPGGRAACMGSCLRMPVDASAGCSSAWQTMFTDFGTILDAVDLDVGGAAGCYVRADGRVLCWGHPAGGILGPGVTAKVGLPSLIAGVTDARSIALASSTACVVRTSGRVRCWGVGTNGELGHGVFTASSAVPVDVTRIDDAVEITAGTSHFCVSRASGEIWCWGMNYEGALGDGTATNRAAPVRLAGVPSGSRLPTTMAGESTCVVAPPDDRVLCVGWGTEGTLGDGLGASSRTPVEVSGLSGAIGVAGSGALWCATLGTQAWCWGLAMGGELGDGVSVRALSPVRVSGLP